MRNIRILLLDDRKDDIELLLHHLDRTDFGTETRTASSKETFIQALDQFEPDVILSDYNMGSFSGIEAKQIARERYPEIPFIIVSGFIGEQEAVNLIVDHGINDYIIKDNLKKLSTSIEREIQRYRMARDLEQKTLELQRLSMVASHTHNGVLIIQQDHRLEWCNRAYKELTGLSEDECVGQSIEDVFRSCGTEEALIKEIQEQLVDSSPFSLEIRNIRNGNIPYWVKLSVTPIQSDSGENEKFVCILEEITARKQAEIELQENIERLRDAQRMGKLGHWEYLPKQKKIRFSDSLKEVYHISSEENILEISEVWALYSEKSRRSVQKDLLRSIKHGSSFESNLSLSIMEEGFPKHVKVLGVPVKNRAGNVISFKGISQDISQQIRYEEQLRESRELLQSITDNVEGAVTRVRFDKNGDARILFASKGTQDVYGVKPSDVIEEPKLIWDQVHPEDLERTREATRTARENNSAYDEVFRVINPDGTLKWVRMISRPDRSANEEIWDTITFDVSELKEMELQLQKSNSNLRQAQKVARMGYFEYYPKTDRMVWSDYMREIFKVSPGTPPPSPSEQAKYHSEEDIQKHGEYLEQCLSDKKPYTYQSTLRFEDGTIKHIKVFNRYTEDEDGVPGISGSIMDITEDRIKEKLLEESEQRLDAAISGADLGIWDLNMGSGHNYVNAQWWKMLGYQLHDIEFTFDFFKSIIHPEDRHLPLQEIERIEAGGENRIDIMIRLKGKDGNYHRILNRGRVVEFDADGKALRLVGTHMDITERFILEEELSKTRTRIDLAVEGAELGLWEMDISSGNTYFNEKWCEMIGYTSSDVELTVDFFIQKIHEKDMDRILGEYQRVLDGKQDGFDVTIRVRHKDGHHIWILDRAKVVEYHEDGSPKTLAGTHLDITERIQAERSYMESNIKLRSLINSSPAGIYLIDDEGKIIDFWNPAAENIFGYTQEEVTGQFMPFVDSDRKEQSDEIMKKIQSGESISNLRLKRSSKSGEQKFIEINTGPIFNEMNELDSVLVIVRDVTELVDQEIRLEESLKEKETLLGEIHHRVKNNLAIVSGILEIQQFTSPDSSTLADAVNRIRSIAMVHEQLYNSESFSRVDIFDYYQELVTSVLKSSGYWNDKVQTNIDITARYISINQAVPLGLLINELLTNSIKHAFTGEDDRLWVRIYSLDDGSFEFEYRDNGPGFDQETINRNGSMGWELINSLLDQLHAEYEINTDNQFCLTFRFSESMRGSQANLHDPGSA